MTVESNVFQKTVDFPEEAAQAVQVEQAEMGHGFRSCVGVSLGKLKTRW